MSNNKNIDLLVTYQNIVHILVFGFTIPPMLLSSELLGPPDVPLIFAPVAVTFPLNYF